MEKQEKFINKAKLKFYNQYNYSNIDYVDSKTKIKIFCNKHLCFFDQAPAEHLRGKKSCKECINDSLKKNNPSKLINKISSSDVFLDKAKKKHNDKYDYSLVDYISSDIKIKIICPVHGIFEQIPSGHVRGKGCNKCSIDKRKKTFNKTKENFISDAIEAHGDLYDYSFVDYVNSQTKVKIICKKHGIFEQLPYDHISKHGCNKCSSSISKLEIEINEFLTGIRIDTITSSFSVIKPSQIDIYIPSHNVAIEFNGLYWHSENKVDTNYHLNKTNLCEELGIQLIHIFEDEWLFKKDIVKSRLKNILGLTTNKIYGRKCIIKEVLSNESKVFLNTNHIQGNVNSSINLGLYHENELVSVMSFNKPRLGIGKLYDGYELSRFCTKIDTTVIGGADKLLKQFIKIYSPKQIISYADKRWSKGNLYEKLGFDKTHTNKPNYSYIIGKTRKHRFNFRKNILKKEGFDITNKSEHEIMLDRKIYRIYDCGTITYKKTFE